MNPAAESKRSRKVVQEPTPDTESRRAELAELVGALNSGESAKSVRTSRRQRNNTYIEFRKVRKQQRTILAIALLILIPGIGSFAFTYATKTEEPVHQPEIQVALPELSPKEEEEIHAVSRKLESKAPNDRTAQTAPPVPTVNHKAEREALLRSLSVGGEAPEFFHANLLKVEAGKSVTCYVLLNTPLDTLTEEAWEEAGMFRNEPEVLNPLLRQVFVENAEAAKRLLIGEVEGVALDLNPPEKPQ